MYLQPWGWTELSVATHLVCNQGTCSVGGVDSICQWFHFEPIFIVLLEVNMGFMVCGIGFRTNTDSIFKWAVMTIVI